MNRGMMMVTTLTLNPCIDRMVTVEKFIYGGLNRIKSSRMDVAGKGVNVAVAIHQLGSSAFCTGINYTERGRIIRAFWIQKVFLTILLMLKGSEG